LDSPAESTFFPKEIWGSDNETNEGFSHSLILEEQRRSDFTFSSTEDFHLPADDPFKALWVDQGLGRSSATDEKSTNTESKITTTTFSKPSGGISGEDSKRRLYAAHYDKNDGRKKRRQQENTTSKGGQGLACPFRKHDAAKYGIQGGWRICALSQWDSIARLKFVSPICRGEV
jgi:hypothetical protein